MVYADWHTPDLQHIGLFIAQMFLGEPYITLGASINAASTFLTVSTNIVVTSLITFRLLRVRCALGKVLSSADMYTGVIAILVESAAPLSIFGIVAAILQQVESASSPGFYVCTALFDGLFYSFCVSSNHQLPQQMPSFLTS
jgi:hypothetical protein